ncbi:ABC transporter ATP-binding protein [Streptomyces piniterrae]|uniref:ABC transporter ATP-binding protein n=1 Tax=Streptomyces piniterrae TaxID=2571125 RepID=A0A4U0MLG6_9ACTN|nr:ATP-binding cassette domain-containing protein [Streptomyces piniterrae]TJZ41477.1 ABC transporter ATP-binding protein [Streptomyces piniterrae]
MASLSGLRVDVAGRRILHDISLTARAGTVTALVGASGSGKTTTGLALLGEYPPGAHVEGRVRVAADGPVGYIPQHPAAVLNPARRVGALLHDIARSQLPRLPRRERRPAARARVLEALAQAQLPEGAAGEALLRRYPHQLSGGQQQRVVLAQALLLGARVIVADEPTTGQDALTKRRIVAELDRVARRGIALVLLSHDLDVVRELADEVVVLRDGRVVESGPAGRVLGAPDHPWTRELLADPAPTGPDDSTPLHETPPHEAPAHGAPPHEAPPAGAVIRVAAARYPSRSGAGSGGSATALRDIDLDVAAGACLAIVGRSGSGKTTLGRCLAGLHRDWDGALTLAGTALPSSIRARSTPQVAAVQYVFQDARAAFDEHRSVLAQTARTAIRLRDVPADEALKEARTAFARVGLTPDLHDRRPARLSGGELQRAALARSLLAHPSVLICDEITSGLDAVSRRGIVELLGGLLREPTAPSLLLITHDLDTAAALADEIAVLDAGEIVERGPAERVLTAPAHPFTTSLVAAARWHGHVRGPGRTSAAR